MFNSTSPKIKDSCLNYIMLQQREKRDPQNMTWCDISIFNQNFII